MLPIEEMSLVSVKIEDLREALLSGGLSSTLPEEV